MKIALISILFDDTMTYTKTDDVIYRQKCSSDRYKRQSYRVALQVALQWLSSVMNRVADSHPEKQGSKPARASSFF